MIKIRVVEVEGQPDEVMKVRQLFGGDNNGEKISSAAPEMPQEPQISSNGVVTVELVLRVLTRRELDSNPRKLLKALMRSGAKGLTSEELAKAVGIDRGQLAGVLGAFGRRIANTQGWPASAKIIEQRRESGRRYYYLSSVVLTALEKLGL